MNKSELQQLSSLNKEIELLKKQIDSAEYAVTPRIARDRVKGSSKYFPFNERTFAISGVDHIGYDRKVKNLKRQLQNRIDDLMDKVAEANEYISFVPDSEIRMILQCKFINRLTWEQIEIETGINERTARRKFKNWWYEIN